jgi:hypothetical protein
MGSEEKRPAFFKHTTKIKNWDTGEEMAGEEDKPNQEFNLKLEQTSKNQFVANVSGCGIRLEVGIEIDEGNPCLLVWGDSNDIICKIIRKPGVVEIHPNTDKDMVESNEIDRSGLIAENRKFYTSEVDDE